MIIGVRHAPVDAAMAGRCYGSTNVGTVLSHGEAARLALASLASLGALEGESLAFDVVWSSDLSRCRGLAEALVPQLTGPLEVRVDKRLRELHHGTFEGRAWDEIHASEPTALERWGTSWQSEGPPQGESAEALERRVRNWIAELDGARRHLLVGHAGVMRAVLVVCQGLDWGTAMAAKVDHLEARQLT